MVLLIKVLEKNVLVQQKFNKYHYTMSSLKSPFQQSKSLQKINELLSFQQQSIQLHQSLNKSINKLMFIGLDISLNSTGINMIYFDNYSGTTEYMIFDVLKFKRTGNHVRGITKHKYLLPHNVTTDTMTIDNISDDYMYIQNKYSIRVIMIYKKLIDIIDQNLFDVNFDKLILSIEGFITPSIISNAQFTHTTSMMMLQGMIRNYYIQKYKHQIKLNIVSPSSLKKTFTGNGQATKVDMNYTFKTVYDGHQLIDCNSIHQTNDVIDAFALNVNAMMKYYHKDFYNDNFKSKKLSKKKKTVNKKKRKKIKSLSDEKIDFEQFLINVS